MTIIVLIVGISLLILIHELGHFLAAKWSGLLVEEFGFGFPPKLFGKKIGETTYTINALPFGGFVRIYGETRLEGEKENPTLKKRSFAHAPFINRVFIIVAGVIMNFLLGWLLLSLLFAVGTKSNAVVITSVMENTPAAEANLQAEDILVGFKTGDELVSFIDQNKGQKAELTIRRGGEEFLVTVTPRTEVPEGEGAVGFTFQETGFERLPLHRAIWEGLKTAGAIIGQVFTAIIALFTRLFTGGEVLKDFVGPVGIYRVAEAAASVGLFWLVNLIALISLNLAVLNIFPFPALDGGRLLFLIIEKIKGSPLSPKFENAVNISGFLLLILLMVVITVKDIVGLF
ncbi:MAG: RIP metalloprotease RseP [Candidatus Harrisonbacteria bacterium CG10_big_fil_rev_8_21_14_0_10_42_17]|uniref:Zinc metalloprotease n=1 Tax=Candidatus Harrisonbacteria bacterium CG10_big_fil_rev_8_21_14_0_10_42_17 TaxID=1974584 RepID=A0A2M6WI32_9BACT|nr:MAG: RIP metalloprotease RseP [Candidatus Harrisonbacteria bacterium CG10_big_fil_rev_8_21_14_0_10_42_17]